MTKTFTPDEFKKRKGMSLGEYENYITKRAIETGLITEIEMNGLKQNLKVVFGYPLSKSVQIIDNLVKLRLRDRIDSERNEEINSDNSFDEILTMADKLKQEHDNNARG